MGQKAFIKSSIKKDNSRSERGDFLIDKAAALYLADGQVFEGRTPAWQSGQFNGEVVFNTGMVGYVESLTDPSYTNQILVFTYPMIGNYGVQLEEAESDKIQVAGVVVSEAVLEGSHSQSKESLLEWLEAQKVPILIGVDTRALTKHLRHQGTMLGAISDSKVDVKKIKLPPVKVGITEPKVYNQDQTKTIILVDCGAKDNILRSILKLPYRVKRVPAAYDYTGEDYEAVVLSNGPGDPTDYQPTIEVAKKALEKGRPVFGICLGNQIMALAAGAKTYKLKFGHRGHNQPCLDETSGRCYITSQNHGYAIDEKSLPGGWKVLFRNLNDNSIEGIQHATKPFFAVQFHPESHPGPTDTAWLFDKFAEAL